MPRQGVGLCLVETRNRFDVSGPIPQLYEESLVILEPVGGAGDRVYESVCVEVLEHLAGSLLEIRGGDDLQIRLRC